MIEMIEREAALRTAGAARGRIIMKMNNLVDEGIIDALYAGLAAAASRST